MAEMINSYWKKVSFDTVLIINDLLYTWEIVNGKKTIKIEYIVFNINQDKIILQKMAVNWKVLLKDQRVLYEYSIKTLIENEFIYLYNEIDNKMNWPKTLDKAIQKLCELHDDEQLNSISHLSWNEFYNKDIDTLGGLSRWIRNNFGLWEGNFDLLLDCKIDDIDADNASISILYHFWEYVVYNIK